MIDDLAIGGPTETTQEFWRLWGRISLLVLDDFLLTPAPVQAWWELLELIAERAQRGSILVASQLPVDTWHPAMADSTLAEAILDRILHSAHRIEPKGRSLRQTQPRLPTDPPTSATQQGGEQVIKSAA